MLDYFEDTGLNLLSLSSDPDGDAIALHDVGLASDALSVPTYPVTLALTIGSITILSDNGDFKVTLASDTNNPDDGDTAAAGTVYFRVIDARGAISPTVAAATINLRGEAAGTPPAYVAAGLDARWAADAGVALSGSDVTTWTDSEGGRVLTAVGTPTVGAPPGGTAGATIVIGPDEGMTCADLSGLPVGAASRTMQAIWAPGTGPFFGGFGYGAGTNGGAFTIAVDDEGELTLDYFGGRVGTGLFPTSQWVIVTSTFDGDTLTIQIGDVVVFSGAVALNTGSARINLCRTFSDRTTTGQTGEALLYGRVLSAAEIAQNVTYLNDRYIGSATVADPDAATAVVVDETGFTFEMDVNSPYAVVLWSARTSSTAATETEIAAGTGALAHGIAMANGDGRIERPVTGAAADTGYYVNAIVYGLTGGKSAVVRSAAITTASVPVAAPSLSSPTLTATGTQSLQGTVTTDTAGGQLEYGLMPGAATTPDQTDMDAGEDGDGAPLIGGLRTRAILAAGLVSVSFAALVAGTDYKVGYRHRNASGVASSIVTASGATLTTTGAFAPDATATTLAGALSIIAGWTADPGGTIPAGKTAADTRIVAVTQPTAGNWTINAVDASAIPGGVIIRGVGPYGWNDAYPYQPTCGSHVNGSITITNCNNVQLGLITCKKLVTRNNTAYGNYKVSVHSLWDTVRSIPPVNFGYEIQNCPGARTSDCHFAGFRAATINLQGGVDDALFEENYVEQYADDGFKSGYTGVTSRLEISRNWYGRDNLSSAGAHSDPIQIFAGTMNSLKYWGNIVLDGGWLGTRFQSGVWLSNTLIANDTLVEECIFAGSAQHGYSSAPSGSNRVIRNCMAIYCEAGDHGDVQTAPNAAPLIDGPWDVNEYNIVCRFRTGSTDTSGTGGICLTIGDLWNNNQAADTSGYPAIITGFPCWNRDFAQLYPAAGSPLHWDYSGQKVGPSLRLFEVMVMGLHPGNRGWPNGKRWETEYNFDGLIPTTFTGVIDDDGNNVTGGTPPSAFLPEVVDESGSAAFTDISALRVSIGGGAWQSLAAAGLGASRTADDEITISGFASSGAAASARFHFEQQQPGEAYNANNSVDAMYLAPLVGPKPQNPTLPGLPLNKTGVNDPVVTS